MRIITCMALCIRNSISSAHRMTDGQEAASGKMVLDNSE